MTTETSTCSLDPARTAARATLAAYEPAGVTAGVWSCLRDAAIDLVLTDEPIVAERARKDLELIAQVAAHLVATGLEVTLDNALADARLASFDSDQSAAGKANGTRENQRGRFRRLQAVHAGVRGCKKRRADGERVETLVQPEIVAQIAALLPADGVAGHHGAGALLTAVDAARCRRRGRGCADVPARVWAQARKFAQEHGLHVTKHNLGAAATYEVLACPSPLVDLVRDFALTRRDLDLGLALAAGLPVEPTEEDRVALRG